MDTLKTHGQPSTTELLGKQREMKIKSALPIEFMEAEFLKAEWYLDDYSPYRVHDSIVNTPDLSNSQHNEIRKSLLYRFRSWLLSKIPADTRWYSGELENNDFEDLLVVWEESWFDSFENAKKLKDLAKMFNNDFHTYSAKRTDKLMIFGNHFKRH